MGGFAEECGGGKIEVGGGVGRDVIEGVGVGLAVGELRTA